MLLNKETIRKEMLLKRSGVSPEERFLFSSQAKRLLLESELFSYKKFAVYAAFKNEFDCEFITTSLWEHDKKVFLPVLQEKFLTFAEYFPETKLILNRYKILEPEKFKSVPGEKLDVVFVPLIAFDLSGNRLGMGAGYYDRTFQFLKNEKPHKPLLIGLGYSFQFVEQLPTDEWDVKLNGILTEKELIYI